MISGQGMTAVLGVRGFALPNPMAVLYKEMFRTCGSTQITHPLPLYTSRKKGYLNADVDLYAAKGELLTL